MKTQNLSKEIEIRIDKSQTAEMLQTIVNAKDTAEIAIKNDEKTASRLAKLGFSEVTAQANNGAENARKNAARLAALFN